MPIDRQNYLGINRAISDYSPSGACEELINLRPTTDGLVPVKPFYTRLSNADIRRVFMHKAPGVINYIAVVDDEDEADLYLVDMSGDDWSLPELYFGTIPMDSSLIGELSFASAGNMILFSHAGEKVNSAFIWREGAYHVIEANIPTINAAVHEDAAYWAQSTAPVKISEIAPEVVEGVIESRLNELQEAHKDVCFGGIAIAIAFKTKDGNTFWTNQWLFYEPSDLVNHTYGAADPYFFYVGYSDFPEALRPVIEPYYSSSRTMGYCLWAQTGDNGSPVRMGGAKLSVRLSRDANTPWYDESSMVESVEIYSTKPSLYFDYTDSTYSQLATVAPAAGESETQAIAVALATPGDINNFKDMNVESQLLYHQASVPMSTIPTSGYTEVQLSFGGNKQLTNKTLDVDAGAVTRYGKLVGYNSRFHYFDSVKKTETAAPFIFCYGYSLTAQRAIFARFNTGEKEELIFLGYHYIPVDEYEDYIIIAPSLCFTEIAIYETESGSGQIRYYRMTPSDRYNYSIHYGPADGFGTVSEYIAKMGSVTSYIYTDEPAAINVTEQYNPFVFKVEHSYLAPGTVLDLQPQMAGMQDTSFGTYPLNVFTSRGVYALMQGTGTVLYSNFRPISNLVSLKNSMPTEMGTFILAAGGLWLIAGNRAVLVSDALHEGPHKYIRSCDGYKRICGPASTNPAYTPVYDVSSYVSGPTFLQYIMGNGSTVPMATLSYNRFRDEIYISNSAYAYTYALSLKYRQWFKIDATMHQDTVGGDVILTPGETAGNINILDLSSEEEDTVLMHLQSRPFSYGYSYAHVHRIVSMIRADIGSTEKLVAALYGSDNLQEWTLLCASKRQASGTGTRMKFSQIRTAPAARSWRYYTICIGGKAPTDTDFGPVLVDYHPVIRRIG